MENFLGTIRALGPARVIALVLSACLILGLFAALVVQVNKPPMSLLYGGLDSQETSRIVELLNTQNVPFEQRGEGSVYVPQDKVGAMRLKVAGEGLVGGSISGYEIFDEGSSFGTTSLVQNINARRSLEGELARTVKSLPVVRDARVHLVLPEKRLFSKENVDASASVTLHVGARVLDEGTVNSIVHLVAASVPNLAPKNVTVVDQRGSLLSSSDIAESPTSGAMHAQNRVRRQIETGYAKEIRSMLEKVAGPGKVNVTVTAELDFDRLEESSELFDPDQQVVRSEQRTEATTESKENNANPAVGVTGNVPGSGTTGTSVGSQEQRTTLEETINYEISKTARHYVKEAGGIKKLSVAVLVEGRYQQVEAEGGEEGDSPKMVKGDYIPYSPENLEKFTTLVKTAIGYDAKRGDKVQVLDMPFSSIEEEAIEEPLFTKQDYFRIAQVGGMAIGMLLLILFVLRPIMTAASQASKLAAEAAYVQATGHQPVSPQRAASGEVVPSGGGGGGAGDGEGEAAESMIDIASVEGKVRESSIKKVAEIIETHPDESIAVVRGWMGGDTVPGEG